MALKIADLLPQPDKIELGGEEIILYPLTLAEIAALLNTHKDAFVALYAAANTKEFDYAQFLTGAPDLVADVIAVSARIQGQEEDVKRIPAAVQLTAMVKIWNLSVPDVKSLAQSLSGVTGGLQKLADERKELNQTNPPQDNLTMPSAESSAT